MKRKTLALIIITQTLFCLLVSGQERDVINVPVKQNNGRKQEEVLYRNSYALLIGNSEYVEWGSLPGVERDIPQVEAVLRDRHGFTVEKALNLSKTALLNRIDQFISNYGQNYLNRLLIYYAGHGYTAVLSDGRIMGYLVMKDAPIVPRVEEALLKTPANLGEFRLNAVSMGEIENLTREITTRHALFVFDSCFSGTVLYRDNIVEIPKEISPEEFEQMRGFLTAGNEKQRVRDDSPFRRAFIKGLEGHADRDGDGYILSTELGAFVKREVYLDTRNSEYPQTPIFGKPERFRRGDMIFVVPKPVGPNESNNNQRAASLANQAIMEILRGNFKEANQLANQSLLLKSDSSLALCVRGWVKYSLERDYKMARTDLEKAVRLNSSNALFHARLAAVYEALNEKDLENKTANEVLRLLNSPKTAIDYYARGVSNSVLERMDDSFSDYTKAIELNPQFALAYSNRSSIYIDKKDYNAAIRDYTKAIEINPQFALAYRNRGRALNDGKDDYKRAITDYDKAIQLNPQDEEAFAFRGLAFKNLEEYDKAIVNLNKAIELYPKYAWAYNMRGEVYGIKTDYDAAIRDYTKAIEINPQFALAYKNRGAALNNGKDDYKRAITDYDKAIQLNPQDEEAFAFRGVAFQNLEEYDKAIVNLNKAIELYPKYAWAYNKRGEVFEEQNNYDIAIRDYTKAIEINPQFGIAYKNRGRALNDGKNDYKRAITDYDKAIQLNPQDEEAFAFRGLAFKNLEEYDKAIVNLNKAIELYPKYAWAYNMRGEVYGIKTDYDAAIRDYTKAIEINPQFALAYKNRGAALNNGKDDYKRAITDYDKAIQLNPQDEEAFAFRGVAFQNLEEYYRAIADLSKAIELDPKYAWAYNMRADCYEKIGKTELAAADRKKYEELKNK